MKGATVKCFSVVTRALQRNNVVSRLDCRRAGLSDDQALEVALLLRVNDAIQECSLSMNSFTDAAAGTVASALEKNTALTALDTRAGEEGLKGLGKALRINTTLKTVRVQLAGVHPHVLHLV